MFVLIVLIDFKLLNGPALIKLCNNIAITKLQLLNR
jgi:hypothetical protein